MAGKLNRYALKFGIDSVAIFVPNRRATMTREITHPQPTPTACLMLAIVAYGGPAADLCF